MASLVQSGIVLSTHTIHHVLMVHVHFTTSNRRLVMHLIASVLNIFLNAAYVRGYMISCRHLGGVAENSTDLKCQQHYMLQSLEIVY